MREIIVFAVVAASVIVVGCNKGHHVAMVDPDVSMISKAKTAAAHDLRDPESVEFREIRVVSISNPQGSSIMSVCGELNAKNEMGGYVGYMPFLYVAERAYGAQEIEEKTHEYPVGDVELVKEDEPQHRKNVAALCTPSRSFPEAELAHPIADMPAQMRALVSR